MGRRHVFAAAAALVVLGLGAGTATAIVRATTPAIPGPTGVFWGCVASKGGPLTILRSASGKCATGQIKVHFSEKGARGKPGATGPAGAPGATGAQGPKGAQGPPGSPNDVIRWNQTVAKSNVRGGTGGATPAPDLSNLSSTKGMVTVATIGTLQVVGICWNDTTDPSEIYAATFIRTTQDGAWAQGFGAPGGQPLFKSDGPVQISEDFATNDSVFGQQFAGPDDGSWAATNAAGTTVIDGFANQGVQLQGTANGEPACSFSGYVVKVSG